MEQRKSITLAILGIIAVVALVGLVFLFSAVKTGAGIYGGGMKGELFPYSRQVVQHRFVETPGWQERVGGPEDITYGGASRLQENTQYERRVTSGSRYKREKGMIPTAQTTCMGFVFKDDGVNVFAPLGASGANQLRAFEGTGKKCFTVTADGIPVAKLIDKIACCTVR